MSDIAVLSSISRQFESLALRPLLIDGKVVGKQQAISLAGIKELLLSRETPAEMRDQLWREIVRLVRTQGDHWATVALGLALPGLSNLAKQFVRDYAETNFEDVCAEVVTAFLEALWGVDFDRPAILTRMYWATYRATRRSAYGEVFAVKAGVAANEARVMPGSGHPDLVLVRLVEEDVITDAEASLISAVRLDRRSLGDVAELLDISANAVLLRLRKAEMRVAAHLTGTTAGSRRAFKQGRKSEVRIAADSSKPSRRTSVDEEPPGVLAA